MMDIPSSSGQHTEITGEHIRDTLTRLSSVPDVSLLTALLLFQILMSPLKMILWYPNKTYLKNTQPVKCPKFPFQEDSKDCDQDHHWTINMHTLIQGVADAMNMTDTLFIYIFIIPLFEYSICGIYMPIRIHTCYWLRCAEFWISSLSG
ncbi:hypothetical protein T265_03659 [Opisthorchis viverrini]|uniref:Uncharacterized protein n=1 Tax=Opisthorchis viverrini TaxID=6198 RepID=A0A074ZV79_OPIVI|nr:hypothetical protein T265_03659 [Opisthorchis viverrini]KER29747.1 hypothetical protein T265_03659 [Opisthorchis viverrini]